jgi:hypothetical protein
MLSVSAVSVASNYYGATFVGAQDSGYKKLMFFVGQVSAVLPLLFVLVTSRALLRITVIQI